MSESPSISEAELSVLKVLWRLGPSTVREVHARLSRRRRAWAYNTVLTLLTRLREKGFVASEKKDSLALEFRAVVTRDDLLQQRLGQLARDVCDGTSSPLVHALVASQRFSREEIRQFRELLDELESQDDPSPPRDARSSSD